VGTFVPARTPGAIVATLNRELNATLQATDVRDALAEQAFEAGALSSEAFARLIHEETARWRKVIEDSGLKPGE
jgi:tripartite-type tricarboxylate transporter receptor subunit TctC